MIQCESHDKLNNGIIIFIIEFTPGFFGVTDVLHLFSFMFCPNMFLYVLSSVL